MASLARSSSVEMPRGLSPKAESKPLIAEDRRATERYSTTFLTCCLESRSGAQIGVIRNISEGGAMIESRLPVSVGERIRYQREPHGDVWARVVWVKDGRMGVKHEEVTPLTGPKTNFRAVRIPYCGKGVIWMREKAFEGWFVNLSQSGFLIELDCLFMPKANVTLEIGSRTFENCSIARNDGFLVGGRFGTRLSRELLADILEGE